MKLRIKHLTKFLRKVLKTIFNLLINLLKSLINILRFFIEYIIGLLKYSWIFIPFHIINKFLLQPSRAQLNNIPIFTSNNIIQVTIIGLLLALGQLCSSLGSNQEIEKEERNIFNATSKSYLYSILFFCISLILKVASPDETLTSNITKFISTIYYSAGVYIAITGSIDFYKLSIKSLTKKITDW